MGYLLLHESCHPFPVLDPRKFCLVCLTLIPPFTQIGEIPFGREDGGGGDVGRFGEVPGIL